MAQRIRWVDIYKGLAILLVVVGHTTGLFNPYIYQFHMAAFFFISGYTSKLGERGLVQTWAGKAYSIYLPYLSFFLITLALVWLLYLTGGYSALFKDPFPGFMFSLTEFPAHRIYINLLGATWFLITLFGIYVVQRTVLFLCFERAGTLFMLASAALFLTGYGIIRATIFIPDGFWYLIFIGQFYFALGYLFSQKGWLNKVEGQNIQLLLLVGVNVVLLYMFSHQWPNTVDYPSRNFGNAFTNSIAAMNGIIFLFIISVIVDKFAHEKVVSVIVKMGRATLGILLFHFLFFKIGYAILAATGVVDWGYVANFTPTHEIGNRYWWLISGLSIALSIAAWNFILNNQLLRTILGQSREVIDKLYRGKSSEMWRLDLALIAGRNRLGRVASEGILVAVQQNKLMAGMLAILVTLAILPMLGQGIICNDELQASFWAQLGWSQFWSHYATVWASQGRVLAAPLNVFSNYMGFLSVNGYVFRSISILLMLVVFALYGWLIARLRNNIYWGVAIFSVAVLLLPISFEHTLPNAFIALFCLPLILAFVSFHLFLTYLETSDRLTLVISMLAWLLFLTSYEVYLTLTPVFLVIAYIHRKASSKDLIKVVFDCRHVLATTIVFFGAYVLASRIFPSHYAGNTIADLNLDSSSAIVGHLVASGVPGYYLFNEKYRYLLEMFSNTFQSAGVPLAQSPLAITLATLFPMSSGFPAILRNAASDPRVMMMAISGVILAIGIGKVAKGREPQIKLRQLPYLIAVPLALAIFMAIPNSLGKLYQSTVNANDFVALPVTFMIYSVLIFGVVAFLWFCIERMPSAISSLIMAAIVLFLMVPIQSMNGVFAQEQNKNFARLNMLKAVYDTDLLRQLDTKSIAAPSLYETKNLLGINKSYWTDYARAKGLGFDVASEKGGQEYLLQVLSDSQVVLIGRRQTVLLSVERVDRHKLFIVNPKTNISRILAIDKGIKDGIFYKYVFDTEAIYPALDEEAPQMTVDSNNKFPGFERESETIGDTFETAQVESGFFKDKWVAKEASLKMRSGKTGKVVLLGALTIPPTDQMVIEVFANGQHIGKYKIHGDRFKIVIPVESGGKVAQLRFRANWEFDAQAPDIRKLSYLLLGLQGE